MIVTRMTYYGDALVYFYKSDLVPFLQVYTLSEFRKMINQIQIEVYLDGPFNPKKSGIDWYDKERYLRYSLNEYLGDTGAASESYRNQTRVDYKPGKNSLKARSSGHQNKQNHQNKTNSKP